MTLAEFLNARLDEDEDLARLGDGYYWGRLLLNDRMRAEVEAKRRILAEHEGIPAGYGYGVKFWCSVCRFDEVPTAEWPCATLCALALPYADHPDYVESWRP